MENISIRETLLELIQAAKKVPPTMHPEHIILCYVFKVAMPREQFQELTPEEIAIKFIHHMRQRVME